MGSDDQSNQQYQQNKQLSPPSSYSLHKQHHNQTEIDVVSNAVSTTPYPALLLSALNVAAINGAKRRLVGYPSVFQCGAYSLIFAASGYALNTGDIVNGSGLTAGWSAIWLFFNARNAFKSRKLFPMTMTTAIAIVGSLYGYNYANIGKE